jgi:hypothetical protein
MSTRDEWLRPSSVVLPVHVPMTAAEIRALFERTAPQAKKRRARR